MSTYPFKYLILICFALSPLINIYSQQKILQFKYLTIDDGLSSSAITVLRQDSEGYMWIGTYNGLNLYDGYTFKIFRNIPNDSTSLPGNAVKAIFEDHNKQLFIGTNKGLSIYNRLTGKFYNFRYYRNSPFYNANYFVYKILEDLKGNLWLCTDFGLIYFDRIKNTIITYTHQQNNPSSISNNYVESIHIDKKNRLWVATRLGLNLFDPKTSKFFHFLKCNGNEDISTVYYTSIDEDDKDNLWFGSYDGLFNLKESNNGGELSLVRYKHNPIDNKSIAHNVIRVIYFDNTQNLWIGTENEGLDLFDKKNNIFQHFKIDDYNPKSLNNNNIASITQDKSNNLWIGTFLGGINITMPNNDAIIHYKNTKGLNLSLSHNVVLSFLEDSKKRIWIGTDGGGINLFSINTGQFTHINMQNSNLKSNAILDIFEDTNNNIWFGTWSAGLNLYNEKTNSFTSYNVQNKGLPDNNIFSIDKDDSGNLWLGSFQNGLIKFNIKEKKYRNFTTNNSGISHNLVNVVKRGTKGRFYLGTSDGFQIFYPETEKFKTFRQDKNNPNSLTNSGVNVILTINDTLVWIGTDEGLNRFNPETETFKQYYIKNGLPDNVIKGLVADKSGNLWVTTNKGICQFDYKNGTFNNFTKDDGLQANEFNVRSVYLTNNNILLFGGTNGFNLVYPEKIKLNLNKPNIVLTDLLIFNKQVEVGLKESPLQKQISELDKLTLTYKQSVFTIKYAAIDFSWPQKNQYAYILDGFEKEWNFVGNKREATYTNLNPGTYIFRVKASNNGKFWNETRKSLIITITPPWWQTIIFRIAFILSIILLAFAFYVSRINILKRQKVLLENIVKERTAELKNKNEVLLSQTNQLNEAFTLLEERQQHIEEQSAELYESNKKLTLSNATKNRFFSIIAHDLKNPFNAILGFSDLLSAKYHEIDEPSKINMIGIISDSSQNIFNLLENLLQWATSQTGTIKYEPKEFNLNQTIESNISIVKNLILEKNLQINHNPHGTFKVFADKNMIDTIIRNLLANAIKFTDAGSITIEVFQDNYRTHVSIIDTGIGISADKLDVIFDIVGSKSTRGTKGELGSGLGLILCKEFIEKNRGTITASSELGKGSIFSFTIPNKSLD